MNAHKRLKLSVAISSISLSALCGSAYAQSPALDELDITISVMEEGETPAGFVNRLVLPSLDSLGGVQSNTSVTAQEEVAVEIVESITEIAEVATAVGADSVREIISIDGTGNVTAGGGVGADVNALIPLPENIVDILNPALPLGNSLQDSLDQVGGGVGTVVDGVSTTGTVVDGLGQSLPLTSDVFADAALDTQLNAIVDNLEPSLAPGLDDVVQGIADEQISLPLEPVPELPNQEPLPVDDLSDSLRELPL